MQAAKRGDVAAIDVFCRQARPRPRPARPSSRLADSPPGHARVTAIVTVRGPGATLTATVTAM